jgi:hypothetical protein
LISALPFNSGAPLVLVAFGKFALARLQASGIQGQLVTEWKRIGEPQTLAAE